MIRKERDIFDIRQAVPIEDNLIQTDVQICSKNSSQKTKRATNKRFKGGWGRTFVLRRGGARFRILTNEMVWLSDRGRHLTTVTSLGEQY